MTCSFRQKRAVRRQDEPGRKDLARPAPPRGLLAIRAGRHGHHPHRPGHLLNRPCATGTSSGNRTLTGQIAVIADTREWTPDGVLWRTFTSSREGEAEVTGGLLRDRDQPGGTLPAGAAVEAA